MKLLPRSRTPLQGFVDFAYEWVHESNPWREAYRDGRGDFEITALKARATRDLSANLALTRSVPPRSPTSASPGI